MLQSNSRCSLCEENIYISYNCNICNYILCEDCLNQLMNMNCPQCRNIIPQGINIVTTNNMEIENARGIYIQENNYNSYINKYTILIIFYLIAGYFFGYSIIQNHKSILINFLLGTVFLSAIVFTFFFLITLLYSACL